MVRSLSTIVGGGGEGSMPGCRFSAEEALEEAKSLTWRHSQQGGVAAEKSRENQGESHPDDECTQLPQAGQTLCP